MQHSQQQMCSVRAAGAKCYLLSVQPEQRIIADWIERTQQRLGWSYADWADRAGIGAPTTITRAIKDEYASVTSVKTLAALAKAAGEPSILDFLAGGAALSGSPAPSADDIAPILAAVLPLQARGRQTAQSLRVVAVALSHGLELLGDQSANSDKAAALGVAARAAASRFRDLTRQ